MKISEFWLREWVNPVIDTKALADQLTMSGLEVKSIEPVADQFTGVVVGRITDCYRYPNDDKLYMTKVDIGNNQLLNIICSASNCRINLKVAVATLDAILPNDSKMELIKLSSKMSEGMLCSFFQLGIKSGDINKIIELPDKAYIGQNIREYLKLDDNIIDIDVTPNRADCLGLLGIARDVAVRNRLPLHMLTINNVSPKIKDTLPIFINAREACPRYLGRIVKNININSATPLWMKEKIRRCGLHPVDVLVDITNYVMLELGQPMHVFDYECIKGGIVVRYATQDETITLFNGSDVILSSDTLVIADYKKVIAIAGISGGATSSINKNTRDIFLECAFFNPLAIVGRAHRYGLHTNASYRYERGVDPELQPHAIERATALILSICGGQPGPVINVISTFFHLRKQTVIILHRKILDRLIGFFIPDEDVIDILTRLGCQVYRTLEGWQTIVPSWRFDMMIEEDLVEEILRIYGYDTIPNVPMRGNLITSHYPKSTLSLTRIKILLADRGYQEAITYSFIDPKIQALLHPCQKSLVLPHPISQKMSTMRLSLLTGLLSAMVYNQKRQQHRIRLFESGLRFVPDKKADLGIRQDFMLSGVISGPKFDDHWDQPSQQIDFYDAKGDIEAIFDLTGRLNDIEFKAQSYPFLHPGKNATIYLNNESIGFIGFLHPKIEIKLNLNAHTLVFELLCEKILECKVPKINNISHFPVNRRDIAIVVPNNIAAADIIAECKKVESNQLVSVKLFDVYRGEGIEEGFKSLAISLILEDNTHTLEEKEIAAIVAKCVEVLKQRFQASLRD